MTLPRIPWTLVAAALLGSCASVQDVLESKDKGTAEVYPVTEDQAWAISRKAFRWEGAGIIEEDRPNYVMMTESGTNAVSWGAFMAAWVEPVDDANTRVTVVTKRRVQVGLFTGMTEGTFHKRFAQGVEIVQRGEPLPLEAPPLEAEKKRDAWN